MKNNNKVNLKYILTMFGIVFLFAGCKNREYKNVIKDTVASDNEQRFIIKDVKTGQERIFITGKIDNYTYSKIGDTVTICVNSWCKEKVYTDYNVLWSGENAWMKVNEDSIFARKKQATFEREMQEFNRLKQEQIAANTSVKTK